MTPEECLDEVAQVGIGELGGGGCSRLIEAAAGHAEHLADLANPTPGLLRDLCEGLLLTVAYQL